MPGLLALVFLLAQAGPLAAPERAASPERVLAAIADRFHSYPPPPFEIYTLVRRQSAVTGGLDPTNSYVKRVWVRTSDRAALTRTVDDAVANGPLSFDRPAFNEARDPGPPTWDLLAGAESRYKVDSMVADGNVLDLHLSPVGDPDRNRLRELVADRDTYALRKVVAADKLVIDRGPTYPVTFTITMDSVQGVPVVTAIHGVVGGNYNDDGKEVDYTFSSIAFPSALPDWYFDPRSYRQHERDAPS